MNNNISRILINKLCCFGKRIPKKKCLELARWKTPIKDEKWRSILEELVWCDEHKVNSDILIEENKNDR